MKPQIYKCQKIDVKKRSKKVIFFLVLLMQFANAQELALVRKEGKFGYISKTGEFAIMPNLKQQKTSPKVWPLPRKTKNGVS